VPLRETVCGLPIALSVIESVPFRLPVASGVNVTLMAQLAPDAREEPQLLVSVKFVLEAIFVMLSVAVPELLSMMDKGWLTLLTTSSPKVNVAGDTITLGDPPPGDRPSDPPPHALNRHDPQTSRRRCFFIALFSKA
jgi:hypothetical protein